MKILHILYQSYPNISGSSKRSNSIINAQRGIGLDPVVITSPFQAGVDTNSGYEVIGGTKYYRCYADSKAFELGARKNFFVRVRKFLTVFNYFFLILRVAKNEKVDVIHSHAMFYNAIPGIVASKILGIPHVYEIRSDWSKNSHFKSGKITKKIVRCLESIAIRLSNSIVVISTGLYAACSKLNRNIFLIGNAVDDDTLMSNKNVEIEDFKAPLKLGYIGSVIQLEGLEYVIEAMKSFKKSEVVFYVVGGGDMLEQLKSLVSKYEFEEGQIIFFGEISPDEIGKAYDNVDAIINYRRDEPVAHSVTPLKPLEAMAYKKLVLTSDVGGMVELVDHMKNGVVVECNNPSALSSTLRDIISNYDQYQSLREEGFMFVERHKVWSRNAIEYKELYSLILKKVG